MQGNPLCREIPYKGKSPVGDREVPSKPPTEDLEVEVLADREDQINIK